MLTWVEEREREWGVGGNETKRFEVEKIAKGKGLN